MSPEAMIRLQELRNKARQGNISLEELRESIKLMREDRVTAAETSAKKKSAAAPVDVQALLGQLMGG